MSSITTKDGYEIFYKDWGSGSRSCFTTAGRCRRRLGRADDVLRVTGFRVIAHDRRGHGRSSQTGDGHDMDHLCRRRRGS